MKLFPRYYISSVADLRAFAASVAGLEQMGAKVGRMQVTIFADGGSRGNPGPAACGTVLYDAQGSVVGEIGVFLGVATNNVAEWQGLIAGLEAAQELGATQVQARLDSELVVKQMRGEYRVKHPQLIPLHRRAKDLAGTFSGFEIRHVRRNENAAADALVNRALDARASFR